MATSTKPADLTQRLLTLIGRPSGDSYAALTLLVKGQRFGYWLKQLPCGDVGEVGFELEKPDGAKYHLRCTAKHIECDCPAGIYRSKCKHSDAIAVLIQRGELERPVTFTPEPLYAALEQLGAA